MAEMSARFYVASVAGATVTLSPLPGTTPRTPAGDGIGKVTVTTVESTADASFWGTTGSCAIVEFIARKMS
jgi:hypothetical protein